MKMRIENIAQKLELNKEKLAKKQNTIEKKEKLIKKKLAQAEKSNENDARWLRYDAESLESDIERLKKEIKEIEVRIAKYEEMLAGEQELDKLYAELYAKFKDFADRTIDLWDAWDKRKKKECEKAREEYRKLSHEHCEIFNDWRNRDDRKEELRKLDKKMNELESNAHHKLLDMTEEDIHRANIENCKKLILNFYDEVIGITGTIDTFDNIRLSVDNSGYCTINGFVQGEKGKATVKSIYAGGYNIQRLHVRVLVHEVKN